MNTATHPTRRSRRAAEAAAARERAGHRAVPDRRTRRAPTAGHGRVRHVPTRLQSSAHRSAGVAVPPSVTPVSHPVRRRSTAEAAAAPHTVAVPTRSDLGRHDLPPRRSLRVDSARPRIRPALRGVAARATRTARTAHDVIAGIHALPTTAAALVACLFVTVSTAGSAVATPRTDAARPVAGQHYVARTDADVPVTRDDFAVRDDFSRDPRSGRPLPTVRPVDGTIPTAGGFGSRHVAGCGACSTDHHGLDFAAPSGHPVLAAMPGTVVAAGPLGGYGNQVLLAHPDGSRTRYGHMSRIDVEVGQRVDAGEQVGAVGSTGVSTGPHLHFEVILGATAVDPAPWLAARGLL